MKVSSKQGGMLESSLEAPLPSSCFSSLILPEGGGRGGRGSVRRGWQYGRFTPGLRPRVASLERGENLENLTILLQGSTKYVLTAWHETKWGRSSPGWWGMNTSFHPPTVCYVVLRVYFYRRLPTAATTHRAALFPTVLFLHASRVCTF